MFGFFRWLRRPSRLAVAEAQAAAKLQCREVHAIREAARRATHAGLLAVVPDEVRARVRAKLAQAEQVSS